MGKSENIRYFFISLLSAAMLWLAWPPRPASFLIFLGFVPLFWLDEQLRPHKTFKFFLFSYLVLVLWNAFTTWWVGFASPEGAIGAIVLNALIMSFPWLLYRITRLRFGRAPAYLALISAWLSMELLHYNWEMPWPWLVLGNVWAGVTDWVQWYEYTGAQGGTLWVLLGNIFIYQVWRAYTLYRSSYDVTIRPALIWLGALIILVEVPILLSQAIKPEEPALLGEENNIVVIQPNIDPYNEKFNNNLALAQVQKLIQLSEETIDSATTLIVWPETALARGIFEEDFLEQPEGQVMLEFLKRHPQVVLLAGASTYKAYQPSTEKPTLTARAFSNSPGWYDAFNTALLLNPSEDVVFYHKSKLVPLVEGMPYPQVLGFLKSINLDGVSGGLGRQDSVTVMSVTDDLRIAPIICYESVFGEYVSEFVREGANVICIITNDGWWEDTDGYKQHLLYARLRAIETRRFIARSANTGISCFITPTGFVFEATEWWQPAAIKSNYSINNELTFYTRNGDYLCYAATWVLALMILALVVERIRKGRINTEAVNKEQTSWR